MVDKPVSTPRLEGSIAPVRNGSGDRGFEALYRSEYTPMVRLARLMIGSRALAEEAVQDAFEKVIDRFDEMERPGAYLRRVVVNNCYSMLRRADLEDMKLRARQSDGEEVVLPPELDETWQSLNGLTPDQRVVIVMRYYDDLTIPQIAELLDEREGTVKSRIHRALGQLKKEVKR